MSHTVKANFEYHIEYANWWDWWVRTNAENHASYMQKLIQDNVTEGKNPIYFVRYEDLVSNKEFELTKLFCFLLDMTDLNGTNI